MLALIIGIGLGLAYYSALVAYSVLALSLLLLVFIGAIRLILKKDQKQYPYLIISCVIALCIVIAFDFLDFQNHPENSIDTTCDCTGIQELYESDQRDRITLKMLFARHRNRVTLHDSIRLVFLETCISQQVLDLDTISAQCMYHIAFLYHHSYRNDCKDFEQAMEYSKSAERMGHVSASWLRKAAEDRWLLCTGKDQKHGTQF